MSKKRTLEEILNDIAVSLIYNQLKTLALDCFTWEGLPEEIQQTHIETALFNHGQAVLCSGEVLSTPTPGLVCLPSAFAQGRNIYNEPLNYNVFGVGVTGIVSKDKCVNIRNNELRTNMHEPLLNFAYKIANVERTADVNVRICKTPYIIHATRETELSLKNMVRDIDENAYAIFLDKKFDMENIDILELTKNLREFFICADLMDYRNGILNQALTFIGINNLPVDKKERNTVDEVNSNNDFIFNNIDARFQWRQNACKEINKLYTQYNVSVKLKHEQKEEMIDPDSDETIEEEMERNL